MTATKTIEQIAEDTAHMAATLQAIVNMCDDCRKGRIKEAKTTNPGMLGMLDLIVEQGDVALHRFRT